MGVALSDGSTRKGATMYWSRITRAVGTALILIALGGPAPAAAEPPHRIQCRTTNGALRQDLRNVVIDMPELAGFELTRKCEQWLGDPPRVAFAIAVLSTKDAGPEQALNEKDGAAKFMIIKTNGRADIESKDPIVLLGQKEALFRMTADVSGFSPALKDAEVLIARVRVEDQNVLFWASYPRSESAKYRDAFRRHFEAAQVTILRAGATRGAAAADSSN